ncbi:MAG TPA: lysophospholipid acyltransferase family protein, partial [Acidimicrobiales bacterium]|nr:lysophospholipid acyltransferase family protein [Acidimicrobiales bacterium]
LRSPTRPVGAEPQPLERRLGVDYETDWARRYPVRLARAMVLDNVTRPALRLASSPTTYGLEHLEALDGPVIVAANHASHLDTALLLSCLPVNIRHHCVVAAAADYFFDKRLKALASASILGAIPMERTRVNRQSADIAAGLIDDGWSLVIFPEGGRSNDGWGQEFKGGAAYLAKRCHVPVVPVHMRGTRAILAKGKSTLRPGSTEVRFGDALWPTESEDARRFAARIEKAVALLADEAETDWWSARRRAAEDASPPFRGPDASPWRRAWSLPASADPTGRRRLSIDSPTSPTRKKDGGARGWPLD